jgi:hypothetical protein
MAWKDNEADDDDFDASFTDNDLALPFGLDTSEFSRLLSDHLRDEHDAKAIDIDITLNAALRMLPTHWLDAIGHAHAIESRTQRHSSRRERIESISRILRNADGLARCVLALPPEARATLRRVLQNGGVIRLNMLERDFGVMTGDGWMWDEHPPVSNIGELRRHGLLFIGKSALTNTGKPAKRAFRVAVAPKDLRDALNRILAPSAVRREEDAALAASTATPAKLLKDALDEVRESFDNAIELPLGRDDVCGFLKRVHEDGMNPRVVWDCLQTLLEFLFLYIHEIRTMNDLCGYHLSEMASSFVDDHYLERWTLDERRELIDVVRRLYVYLRATGRIDADAEEEILHACARLSTGKRKLNLIHRPPPLGGELLLLRINPNTGDEERYTINHQRLIMVWVEAFHQDWRTVLRKCADVPDSAAKAQLVNDLIALEPAVCELLIARTDGEDADAALRWFYEESVIALSAW